MAQVPFLVNIAANDAAPVPIVGVLPGAEIVVAADDTGGAWGGGTLTFYQNRGSGNLSLAAYTADQVPAVIQTGYGELFYQFTGGGGTEDIWVSVTQKTYSNESSL